MALGVIDDSKIINVAKAIREKNGEPETTKYTVDQLPDKIKELGGGSVSVQSTDVTTPDGQTIKLGETYAFEIGCTALSQRITVNNDSNEYCTYRFTNAYGKLCELFTNDSLVEFDVAECSRFEILPASPDCVVRQFVTTDHVTNPEYCNIESYIRPGGCIAAICDVALEAISGEYLVTKTQTITIDSNATESDIIHIYGYDKLRNTCRLIDTIIDSPNDCEITLTSSEQYIGIVSTSPATDYQYQWHVTDISGESDTIEVLDDIHVDTNSILSQIDSDAVMIESKYLPTQTHCTLYLG